MEQVLNNKDLLGHIISFLPPGKRFAIPLVAKQWDQAVKKNKWRMHPTHRFIQDGEKIPCTECDWGHYTLSLPKLDILQK